MVNRQDNVLDGCAGPHIGNESREEYLDNSIDREMGWDGQVTDIEIYEGVKNIE